MQKLLELSSAELAVKFVDDPHTFAAAIDEFADICERCDPIVHRYFDPVGELRGKFEEAIVFLRRDSEIYEKYQADCRDGVVPPLDEISRFFRRVGSDPGVMAEALREYAAHWRRFLDSYRKLAPTKTAILKKNSRTKEPSKLNEQRLQFHEEKTTKTPGITIPEVVNLWNAKHKQQVDDSAFSNSLSRARKARENAQK